MFKERLISGIVLLIVMISTIIVGGNVLFSLITAISLIGLMELYRVVKLHNTVLGFFGYAASLIFDFLIYFGKQEYLMIFFVAFLLVLMAAYVILYPKYVTEQITHIFFGLFYVTIMLSFIYQVRMLNDGFYMVWLIFIGAWGSDTCAYCVGMLIGKHKLPSELSPKKSIEGCIGGVIGAALIGMIYAAVFKNQITEIASPVVVFAIIGAAGSIIAQIGDLAASAIKRNHEIKDYGKLIPGHGGILDRFDSIIFTAPVVYILLQFL
ncbi:phosphatidate cytidylyltransferase [Lachnospiraceae bacterium KM106-2]|nr:phosphatidate cytidylyltransferase [Lachnospiraceae bacterium KM106-2]